MKKLCGLQIVHNSFQHDKKRSNWGVKKLLNAIFKIFDGSPSCLVDFEKLTFCSKTDYCLCFCFHRWVENHIVKKAQVIWPKVFEVLDFWKALSKWKQPGQWKQGVNMSDSLSSIVYWGYQDNFKPVYFFLRKRFCAHKNTSQAKIS